jgi:hypothetical protein
MGAAIGQRLKNQVAIVTGASCRLQRRGNAPDKNYGLGTRSPKNSGE